MTTRIQLSLYGKAREPRDVRCPKAQSHVREPHRFGLNLRAKDTGTDPPEPHDDREARKITRADAPLPTDYSAEGSVRYATIGS